MAIGYWLLAIAYCLIRSATRASTPSPHQAERLAAAEPVRSEGWKWIECDPAFNGYRQGLRNTYPVSIVKPDNQARHDEIETELDRLENETDWEELNEAETEKLEDRMSKLMVERDGYVIETFTDEIKACAGVIVTIGQNGKALIYRGLVRLEDERSVVGDGDDDSEGGDEPTSTASAFSAALMTDLTAERTCALALRLQDSPRIALALTVFNLVKNSQHRSSETVLDIRSVETPRLSPAAMATSAAQQWTSFKSETLKQFSKNDDELWQTLKASDSETLEKHLALLIATSLNAIVDQEIPRFSSTQKRLANANHLAAALYLDMSEFFDPTPEYFLRVRKSDMADAILESGIQGADEIASGVLKMKKKEAAEATAKALKGSGWLPLPLRSSTVPAASAE